MTNFHRSNLLIVLCPLASMLIGAAIWGVIFLAFTLDPEAEFDNEILLGFASVILFSAVPGILTGTFIAFSRAGIFLSALSGAVAGSLSWVFVILFVLMLSGLPADSANDELIGVVVITPIFGITAALGGATCGYVLRRLSAKEIGPVIEIPPPPNHFNFND
jgi:hypothetical protein